MSLSCLGIFVSSLYRERKGFKMGKEVIGSIGKGAPKSQPGTIVMERNVTIFFEVKRIHPGASDRGRNVIGELVIYDNEWERELVRSGFTLREGHSLNIQDLRLDMEIQPSIGQFEFQKNIPNP